jgi:hypothetical protein
MRKAYQNDIVRESKYHYSTCFCHESDNEVVIFFYSYLAMRYGVVPE